MAPAIRARVPEAHPPQDEVLVEWAASMGAEIERVEGEGPVVVTCGEGVRLEGFPGDDVLSAISERLAARRLPRGGAEVTLYVLPRCDERCASAAAMLLDRLADEPVTVVIINCLYRMKEVAEQGVEEVPAIAIGGEVIAQGDEVMLKINELLCALKGGARSRAMR